MQKIVLVADDERSIADIIAYNLKKENYQPVCAYDGQEAFDLFKSKNPDLLILDVMMPKINGFDLCKRIRELSDVPIIMLTARVEEIDKVFGLENGADDYVTKPFGINELMARVKANLRRIDNSIESDVVTYGKIRIDFNRYQVFNNDKLVILTPKEFELLKFLAMNANKVFTREELLKKVWAYEYYGDMRTVDVTIRRLRLKLEKNPENPEVIATKRGVGYYFRLEAN